MVDFFCQKLYLKLMCKNNIIKKISKKNYSTILIINVKKSLIAFISKGNSVADLICLPSRI